MNIAKNRCEWIQALRENGDMQCLGWDFTPNTRQACAVQLIVTELKGAKPLFLDPIPDYGRIADWLGVTAGALMAIYTDNDMSLTFARIADRAEAGVYWNLDDNVVPLARAA